MCVVSEGHGHSLCNLVNSVGSMVGIERGINPLSANVVGVGQEVLVLMSGSGANSPLTQR